MKFRFAKELAVALLAVFFLAAFQLPVFAQSKSVKKGDPLPVFALRDAEGKYRRIEDLRGERPLVLSFFATSCKPCKEELPHLQDLHEKYGDRLAVVLVTLDPTGHEAFAPFAKKHGVTFPVLHDAMGIVKIRFGISTLPRVYVTGADGVIADILTGYSEKRADEFVERIVALTLE